jgi:hypothetical protein
MNWPDGSERSVRTVIRLCGCIVCVAALTLGTLAGTHIFDKDEIEHVHAAWLIAAGLHPYRGFFEHHHPLLWYGLRGLLPVLPASSTALVLIRMLMLAQTVGIAVLTWILARRTIGRPGAWLAVALLLSMSGFGRNAYTIRPDVPQTLCVLAGAVCLTDRSRRAACASVAGLLFGVGVLFSLKAVLATAATGALLLMWRQRRHVDTRFVVAFVLSCIGPIAAYALYLLAAGEVRDYYVSNWMINAVITLGEWDSRAPRPASIVPDLLFWALGIGGAVWLMITRPRIETGMAVANGVGTAAMMIAAGRWESRSVMLAAPFLATTAATAVVVLAERLSTWHTATLTVTACLPPLVSLALMLPETSGTQRARIDYVLENTVEADAVYDANGLFNLFRPDLHYIWFHPKLWPDLQAPVRAVRVRAILADTLGRETYDACALVAAARPRFVSSVTIDLDACGLAGDYEPTPFEWTLRRR